MTEVAERVQKLQERIDRAVGSVSGDPGASPVLVAVVRELGRKFAKARPVIERAKGPELREAVVEAEQAADSARYAAEADEGLGAEARQAVLDAHDRLCVFKTKLEA